MTRMWNTQIMTAATGVLIVSIAVSQPASADHEGSYANASTYSLKLTHMPDFDQRRAAGMGLEGLPGNGGWYCVPTSGLNLYAYAANHGFPDVAPGPAWWQSQILYPDATDTLQILGALMGTGSSSGTNPGNFHFGSLVWLSPTDLTVSTFLDSGNACPTITNIAQSVAMGGIVAFWYGRYNYLGNVGGTDFVGAITGGHCVTFSEATRSGSNIVIKVRDPADDPDWSATDSHLFSQSMFTNKVYSSPSQRNVSNFGWFRTMTALIYPPPMPADPEDAWLIRLVYGYQVIRPKSGYSWQPGINNDPPKINFYFPPMGGGSFFTDIAFELASMLSVNDFGMSPDHVHCYVVGLNQTRDGTLQRFELPNGESTEITPIANGRALTVGRKQEIYVLTDNSVLCIDPFNDEEPVQAQVFPPGPCNAMCYDDARDELLLLSPEDGMIYTYAHRFEDRAKPIGMTCIPAAINLEPDEGNMAINPVDSKAWFATPASHAIYHVPPDPVCEMFEQISFPQITNPRSLSFDDKGHLFVACDAGLVEVMFSDEPGGWMLVNDPYFDDSTPVGAKFYVTRSRTNYDPLLHDGPEWQNVDPEEERNLEGTHLEIDCLADLVTSATFQPPPDGVVDAADLAYLLGAWGDANGSSADIVTSATFQPPEDGIVDAADLAFLLGAWGECP